MPPVRRLRELPLQRRRPHTRPGPHCVRDSSRGEDIRRPGLRSSEPPGLRGNARVCKFHAADHGVNARVVPQRGFGVAAGFSVFQLRIALCRRSNEHVIRLELRESIRRLVHHNSSVRRTSSATRNTEWNVCRVVWHPRSVCGLFRRT